MRHWVKIPGPGQFRGEGEWVEAKGEFKDFLWFVETGYLPTHTGDTPPDGPDTETEDSDGA